MHASGCFSRPLRNLAVIAALGLSSLAAGSQQALARQGFAAIAVDAHTGKILFGRNIDARRIPASVTKVMTLYLLFGEIRKGRYSLSSRLMISRHAASMAPSKLGLKPGSTISVDNAIRIIVTKSANDIAVAVGENIAGSERAFAYRMTRTAHAMGMTRTIFRNASGLPKPPNVTTARDLATLALRIQRDFPRLYKRYFAIRTFRYGRRVFRNHNHLLGRVRGMDGLKTGYTRAAGFNLAASTARGGKRIVTVVLGGRTSRSRNAYMARLINQMFRTRPLTRGVAIAAAAGHPDGWRAAMARLPFRIQARNWTAKSASTAKTAKPAKAAEPSRLALLSKAASAQARPVANPAPLPKKRPARLVAARDESAHAGGAQARPRPVLTIKEHAPARAQDPAGPAHEAVRGQTFVQVRPEPGLTRLARAKDPAAAEDSRLQTASQKGQGPTRKAKEAKAPSGAGAHEDSHELVISKAGAASTGKARAKGQDTARPKAAQERAKEPLRYSAYLRSWNIQLGAYPTREGAKSVLNKARRGFRPYLTRKQAYTMVFRKGPATYYRARFSGFDRTAAMRACRMMKRRKVSCYVLAPAKI